MDIKIHAFKSNSRCVFREISSFFFFSARTSWNSPPRGVRVRFSLDTHGILFSSETNLGHLCKLKYTWKKNECIPRTQRLACFTRYGRQTHFFSSVSVSIRDMMGCQSPFCESSRKVGLFCPACRVTTFEYLESALDTPREKAGHCGWVNPPQGKEECC